MTVIRLALVEDKEPYRRDLIRCLENSGSLRCVCDCGTAEEAVERIPRSGADVVLMDLELPGRSGIDCIRDLKLRMPGCRVLVLTQHRDNPRIFQAFAAGAMGYCLKRHAPLKLEAAIRDIHAGNGHLSPEVASAVAKFHHESNVAEDLTPAEGRILELLKTTLSVCKILRNLLGVAIGRSNDRCSVSMRSCTFTRGKSYGGGSGSGGIRAERKKGDQRAPDAFSTKASRSIPNTQRPTGQSAGL